MKNLKSLGVVAAFLLVSMIVAQAQPTWLTNGLVAYYRFDGNANDQSGNNRNGSTQNTLFTTNRFGMTNTAILFNGINSSFQAGSFPLMTTSLTYSAWVKINGSVSDPNQGFGTIGSGSAGNFTYNIGSSFWGLSETRNGTWEVPQGVNSPVFNWVLLDVVYDSTGKQFCYANGVLLGSRNVQLPLDHPGNNQFYIGSPGSSQYLNGCIDDVRIYNRALSSNEVAQLYAIESAPLLFAPQITADLTNFFAIHSQNTTLSIGVTSSVPMIYQWYWVPENNGGQAGAYAQTISGFVYGVVVTNGGNGYGNIPNIGFVGGGGSGAGAVATVSNGVVAAITMTNAGLGYTSAPLVVIGSPNGKMIGQTNSSLTISNANQSSLGSYHVVVSNEHGSVTSSVVSLTVLYPPSIAANPVGFTADYHSSNNLEVLAGGTAPFTYQWSLNNTNLPSATNNLLSIASLTLANTGDYKVVVSNPYGAVTSSPAAVYMSPTLVSPFGGAVALWGENASLSVGAIGSGSLIYQWYFNGSSIPGANSSSYLLSSIQFTNAGLYNVVVSSTHGSVTNQAYQVVVNPANTSLAIRPHVIIQGTVGYNYTVQSSTNLGDINAWMTETNLVLPTATYEWSDYNADTSKSSPTRKFYRVLPGQ